MPTSEFIESSLSDGWWARIPGYNSMSNELVLSVYRDPYRLDMTRKLLLWYGEDERGYWEYDNVGRVCCDVYALYN